MNETGYWHTAMQTTCHNVRKPPSDDDGGDQKPPDGADDEAPETPTDEPPPVPIQDPPSEPAPTPPLTVGAFRSIPRLQAREERSFAALSCATQPKNGWA